MFLHSAILLIVFQSITFTIGLDCIERHLLPRVRECCRIPPPFPDTGLRECDREARREHSVASYVMQKVYKLSYAHGSPTTPRTLQILVVLQPIA